MKQVITEFGNEFYIADQAYSELADSRNARQADYVFSKLADHVPRRHRNDVWQAIPATTETENQ